MLPSREQQFIPVTPAVASRTGVSTSRKPSPSSSRLMTDVMRARLRNTSRTPVVAIMSRYLQEGTLWALQGRAGKAPGGQCDALGHSQAAMPNMPRCGRRLACGIWQSCCAMLRWLPAPDQDRGPQCPRASTQGAWLQHLLQAFAYLMHTRHACTAAAARHPACAWTIAQRIPLVGQRQQGRGRAAAAAGHLTSACSAAPHPLAPSTCQAAAAGTCSASGPVWPPRSAPPCPCAS